MVHFKKLVYSILVTSCFLIPPVHSLAQTNDADSSNTVNFSTDVIYQIVTDRFNDGNPTNNPTGNLFDGNCINLKKYCGGDWQGIIDKINDNYFSEMGISALWISPPVENMNAVINDTDGSTSYHGYWAKDFKRPNPYFGSFSDFDRLIAAAHAKGIKVIIDFAPNHTSPANENVPSYAENGVWVDDGVFLGAYTNDAGDFFHHNGGTDFSTIEDGTYRNLFDLADFNHQNPIVDNTMQQAIEVWLDHGIDGIRADAVKHMPFGWQKKWMSEIYDHRPVFTFGEWFLGANEVDPANHTFANESGMSLLDFEFAQQTRQVFRDNNADMVSLHNMIMRTENVYQEVSDQVTFIDNHDMDRFHTSGGNQRALEQAVVFTLTSRGVPGIYYGTEHYVTGNGDPNNRARMPSFSRNSTVYNLIKSLAPLRKQNPAFAYGSTQERWLNSSVYVYERRFGDSVALVAINRSTNSGFNLTGLMTSLPNGNYSDVLGNRLNGESINVSNGSVTPIFLAPGETSVWHYIGNSSAPNIGHVGPMIGKSGEIITIDGRGFGNSQNQGSQVRFGNQVANVISWSDNQIKVAVPNNNAGKYDITVGRSGLTSNLYDDFEVLSGSQVSVRFIVNNGFTQFGENIFLLGNQHEIGNWDPNQAIGAMFNDVITTYPTWYFDVSVPAGKTIEFKFIKKNGNSVTFEGGENHTYTTPSSGVGTVIVDFQL
jgi:glycosidase